MADFYNFLKLVNRCEKIQLEDKSKKHPEKGGDKFSGEVAVKCKLDSVPWAQWQRLRCVHATYSPHDLRF